jgi:glycine cleavage system transcriptional repressor
MKKFLISMLGRDRPGIIAAATRLLSDKGFNIEDVRQTILQSEFSGIFIITAPDDKDSRMINDDLTEATLKFNMHCFVKELPTTQSHWTECDCEPFVITTRGPDQKGLVAEITAVLASYNVNVTQLQAVFRGGVDPGLNVMVYEVDIPIDTDQGSLKKALHTKADTLHLEINIQHKNIFEVINRI